MEKETIKKGFMYEKLCPITIGHSEITEKQKKESNIRIRETMKKVNKRLKKIRK